MPNSNWSDQFWMKMALEYANGSKDPSLKVGSIIVRPDKTPASFGVNGFPRGIVDSEHRMNDRDMKYDLTIHAETNALLFAKEPVNGYTLYCTFCPCIRCCVNIIQSGISRVVYLTSDNERWNKTQANSILLFKEAGVEVIGLEVLV